MSISAKILEKVALVAMGIVILGTALFNPIGCANQGKNLPPAPPTPDIKHLGEDIGNTGKDLKTTTDSIRTNATNGQKATPPVAQPILTPYWTNILTNVGVQDQLVKNLDQMKTRADEAEKKSAAFEKSYNDEHTARVKAEDNTTKELRNKYLAYSGILFFASLILFGVAIFNGGNKLLMWGGTIAGVGSAVCIFIVQTAALIPWIVGGAAVIAVGFVIYSYIHKNGQISLFKTATSELVETVEATKPKMTMAGRARIFGDGPGKGEAFAIQSKPTEALVKQIRKNIETAPKLPPTVAVDWNGDGIIDERDVAPIELVTPKPALATIARKKVLS